MALLSDTDISSKHIERLLGPGGLYILKQSHALFDVVSSDEMHSEKLSSKSLIFLTNKPSKTTSTSYLFPAWPVFYNHQDLIAHSENFHPI